jgi:23S rRNA (uracil1939-C5)-methyltransferase
MRCCKQALPLQADYFPIATPRIQKVMTIIMGRLNFKTVMTSGMVSCYKYELIRENLSSISFVASWSDALDCVVTFNYCEALYSNTCDDCNKDDVEDHEDASSRSTITSGSGAGAGAGGRTSKSRTKVLAQATEFFMDCNDSISSLILRSKNLVEIVGGGPTMPYIEDVLYLKRMPQDGAIKICLDLKSAAMDSIGEDCFLPILYSKPVDAFQHPNRNTMLQALNWMVNKLKDIVGILKKDWSDNDGCHQRGIHIHMLEMYCGCGAHTMAVAKSNIFDSIVAIELDQRLVDACIVNCKRNGCCPMTVRDGSHGGTGTVGVTPVYVFQGDASEWAKRSILKQKQKLKQKTTQTDNEIKAETKTKDCIDTVTNKSSKSFWYNQYYHVLLVDPPRMGLSEEVIKLATQGSFEHIIYVSCGRRALIRDLMLLRESFDVVDLVITDLFPRTDSVETILHLRRR